MSGIISSFFIEPVVRQARRFSSAAPGQLNGDADGRSRTAAPLSHANSTSQETEHTSSPASSSVHPHALSSPQCPRCQLCRSTEHSHSNSAHVPRGNNNVGLGQALFDRFVPLTSRSAITEATRSQCESNLMAVTENGVEVSAAEDSSCSEQHINLARVQSIPSVPDQSAMEPNQQTDSLRQAPTTPPRTRGGIPIRPRRSSARDASQLVSDSSFPEPGSLPADDGKQSLRARIHTIRDTTLSVEEKARRMHSLMTESWQASQAHLRAQSPASMTSPVRPRSSGSLASLYSTNPTSPGSPPSSRPALDPANPFNVHPPDLLPSYRPPPPVDTADESPKDEHAQLDLELGCQHYKRNVKVQCCDCKLWYPCRHCHDAAQTDHILNRHATENMLCMVCQTPQPAAQSCKECGVRAAWYFCDICKLWDDDVTKRIYHCTDCGICRRGEGIGKDFTHCKKCNVCIPIQSAVGHRCIERATECDCPICHEYMFNSSEAIVSMPCGHYLHQTCYAHYITPPSDQEEGAYQCPICKKSALNMEVKWRKLDSEIQQQPMPIHLRDMKVEIRCIDCEGRSIVNLHWLGNKCALCDGYNTVVVLELGREGDEAAAAAELRRRVMRANMERRRASAFMSQPRARRYFQDEDEEGTGGDSNTERPNSAAGVGGEVGIGFGSAAYEMLARMSRSLNAEDVGILENNAPDRPSSAAGAGEAGFAFGTTAYEMLARMSRSLSPIRHYFDSDGEEAVRRVRPDGSRGEDDSEQGFWGESEDYIDDEDDSSDDEYDSDDSLADEDLDDEEEEGEGHGLDELDLQLIGHR